VAEIIFVMPSKLALVNKIHWTESGLPDGAYTYLHNKNIYLGMFWRAFEFKMLVYFIAIWYNLRQLGIHNLRQFGIFFKFWYVVTRKIWQTLTLSFHPIKKCSFKKRD
jgi:hypothetical protein